MRYLSVLVLTCGAGLAGLVASACGVDLPAGWEQARAVSAFTQHPCEAGSAYSGVLADVTLTAGDGRVDVLYQHARFRCDQDVTGFYRSGPGTLDILVQPEDMSPASVARCDCLYDIELSVTGLGGTFVVTLYRRADSYGGNDTTPQVEGVATVTVLADD